MGLHENIRTEPVSTLSLRGCAVVERSATVADAVAAMRVKKVGAVIVIDAGGRAVGMFNERKLIHRLAADPAVLTEPVEHHMARELVCVRRDDPIVRLIRVMQEHAVRWVCVVDEEGRPVALTGVRGVIEYFADHFPHQVLVQPTESSKLSIEQREGA